jgi:subtilisin
MKHLAFIAMLCFAFNAQADRYIVTEPAGTLHAQALASKKVVKRIADESLVLDISQAEAEDLAAQGYEVEKDGVMSIPEKLDSAKRVTKPANASEVIPWGIVAMKVKEVWKDQYTRNVRGRGVTVCVLDTGVNPDHPDLQGQIAGGASMISGVKSYRDDQGHGTHVAGTIVAKDNTIGVIGVAPEAKVFAIKVLNKNGSGSHSDIAAGIRYAIGKCPIISMSLGGYQHSKVMESAVKAATDKGAIIVAAAGNDGRTPILYPARYPGVFSVASANASMRKAAHSNYGEGLDFIAPGEGILSTVMSGGYERWNGTSMATPHMAGAFAVMIGAGKTSLKTDDLGLEVTKQGRGFPNLQKTLQ